MMTMKIEAGQESGNTNKYARRRESQINFALRDIEDILKKRVIWPEFRYFETASYFAISVFVRKIR
jgi:hypothetical protein